MKSLEMAIFGSMMLTATIAPAGERATSHTRLASELSWAAETPGRPVEIVTLWGSRTEAAAGVLIRVPGGWESGLHAHTSDYEAVAIEGVWIHSEEEGNVGADKELVPGSHWSQPSHAMHSDKCKEGKTCVVFVYTSNKTELVPGRKGGGARGKRGRIAKANEIKWAPQAPNLPQQISVLWGSRDKGPYGMLIKLPPGFDSTLHAHTGAYDLVVISGPMVHVDELGAGADKVLTPGSHVYQVGKGMHIDKCRKGTRECLILVTQTEKADILWPAKR